MSTESMMGSDSLWTTLRTTKPSCLFVILSWPLSDRRETYFQYLSLAPSKVGNISIERQEPIQHIKHDHRKHHNHHISLDKLRHRKIFLHFHNVVDPLLGDWRALLLVLILVLSLVLALVDHSLLTDGEVCESGDERGGKRREGTGNPLLILSVT